MQAFLISLFDAIGIKNVIAMLAFSVCAGLGAFIDAEAKPAYKEKVQASLQAGAWFQFFRNAYENIGGVLDVWLGKKLFSWRSSLWTFAITLFGSVVAFGMMQYVRSNYFSATDEEEFFPMSREAAFNRVPAALIIDYITLVRVRVFCHRANNNRVISSLIIATLIDAMTFGLAIFITAFATVAGESLHPIVHFHSLVSLSFWLTFGVLLGWDSMTQYMMAIPAFASLLPALIFYVFTLALIVLKGTMVALGPIARFSTNLKFTKPFLLIGNVAGLISALIIAFGEWIGKHV